MKAAPLFFQKGGPHSLGIARETLLRPITPGPLLKRGDPIKTQKDWKVPDQIIGG